MIDYGALKRFLALDEVGLADIEARLRRHLQKQNERGVDFLQVRIHH